MQVTTATVTGDLKQDINFIEVFDNVLDEERKKCSLFSQGYFAFITEDKVNMIRVITIGGALSEITTEHLEQECRKICIFMI